MSPQSERSIKDVLIAIAVLAAIAGFTMALLVAAAEAKQYTPKPDMPLFATQSVVHEVSGAVRCQTLGMTPKRVLWAIRGKDGNVKASGFVVVCR